MGASQLGLFEPRGRHDLDATSWIEHFRAWLPNPARLFDSLSALNGWEQRSRWMFTRHVIEPRLTVEFPRLEDAPVAEVRDLGTRLSKLYGVDYDSAWMNLYRDHQDSTAWHADRPSCRREICIVPVISLGATRRFVIRPKEGGRSQVIVVEAGDLIVMGGRCQRDWVHAVPKETRPAGARISVNFGSTFQATKEE